HAQGVACAFVDVAGIATVAGAAQGAEVLLLEDLGIGDDGAERGSELVCQPLIVPHGGWPPGLRRRGAAARRDAGLRFRQPLYRDRDETALPGFQLAGQACGPARRLEG